MVWTRQGTSTLSGRTRATKDNPKGKVTFIQWRNTETNENIILPRGQDPNKGQFKGAEQRRFSKDFETKPKERKITTGAFSEPIRAVEVDGQKVTIPAGLKEGQSITRRVKGKDVRITRGEEEFTIETQEDPQRGRTLVVEEGALSPGFKEKLKETTVGRARGFIKGEEGEFDSFQIIEVPEGGGAPLRAFEIGQQVEPTEADRRALQYQEDKRFGETVRKQSEGLLMTQAYPESLEPFNLEKDFVKVNKSVVGLREVLRLPIGRVTTPVDLTRTRGRAALETLAGSAELAGDIAVRSGKQIADIGRFGVELFKVDPVTGGSVGLQKAAFSAAQVGTVLRVDPGAFVRGESAKRELLASGVTGVLLGKLLPTAVDKTSKVSSAAFKFAKKEVRATFITSRAQYRAESFEKLIRSTFVKGQKFDLPPVTRTGKLQATLQGRVYRPELLKRVRIRDIKRLESIGQLGQVRQTPLSARYKTEFFGRTIMSTEKIRTGLRGLELTKFPPVKETQTTLTKFGFDKPFTRVMKPFSQPLDKLSSSRLPKGKKIQLATQIRTPRTRFDRRLTEAEAFQSIEIEKQLPVQFRYGRDPRGTIDVGDFATDVAKVFKPRTRIGEPASFGKQGGGIDVGAYRRTQIKFDGFVKARGAQDVKLSSIVAASFGLKPTPTVKTDTGAIIDTRVGIRPSQEIKIGQALKVDTVQSQQLRQRTLLTSISIPTIQALPRQPGRGSGSIPRPPRVPPPPKIPTFIPAFNLEFRGEQKATQIKVPGAQTQTSFIPSVEALFRGVTARTVPITVPGFSLRPIIRR